MTPTIEELARGLTEAQRNRIAAADVLPTGDMHIDALPPHGLNAHIVTMYSLTRDRLTPLGLTLRAYLEKTHE